MPLEVTGKYFLIRSRMNGMVLDVAEGITDPGARVITWPEHRATNQQWYHEPLSNTVRSRLSGLCMQCVEGELQLQAHDPEEQGQQFSLQEECVCNVHDHHVLDVVGGDTAEGAKICLWEQHGGENQKWEFVYLEPEYFKLQSLMHSKCLDMEMGKTVILRAVEEGVDEQVWYEDRNSQIRNKVTDQVLDLEDGIIQLNAYDSSRHEEQGWTISGNQILNRYDQTQCIAIQDKNSDDGANLVSEEFTNEEHQQWTTIPV